MLHTAADQPPPLDALRLVTAWRFAPGGVVAMAALATPYAAGVLRWRRHGQPWPRSRSVAFAMGVGLIGVVSMSFVGVYDDTLFWARALQNLLLVMVVPLFLALGAPLTLLAAAIPARRRPVLRRWFHSRPAQVLTFPLVVTLILVLPLLVMYLSPLYEQTLRNGVVSGAVAVALTTCGFVYFWSRIRLDPTPRAGSHLVTIVEVVGDAVLGVILWLGPLVAAGWYLALHRTWGPAPHTDQLLGAGILWVGGDVVGLPFIGVIVHRFMREDERRARDIDQELDEAEASLPTAARPQTARLWWEDDPQLAPRFRRR